jgi:hypothetical protein
MCETIDALSRIPKTDAIIAEEIQNASTVVPWVMISSIMLNGVMGLALLVCYDVSSVGTPDC